MGDPVIVAIISGGLTLIGTIATILGTNSKTKRSNETSFAVLDVKITQLTEEVHKHNNFAEKIPVLTEKIEVANHRIEDLEKDVKRLSEGKHNG